jgi:DNA-binding beta-propeller fold protein YncE
VATPAQAAPEDPLFVFVPTPPPVPIPPIFPPPFGYFNGPCGMAVDSQGSFWVSDYYHDVIDIYDEEADYVPPPKVEGSTGFLGQLSDIDALDGPCGLAIDDGSLRVYVNDYHRAVIAFDILGSATTITGAGVDEAHPTGVAVDPATGYVYVNDRTHIAVFDSSGDPVEDGGEPLLIGEGSLQDGYGLAFSTHSGTAGRLYVPDAATDTVKVYDPTIDKDDPVTTINGSATPEGEFVSLRDAAIAVDRVTGQVYVVDNLQPQYTEKPEAIVYVFSPAGAYQGHLKYNVTDALPAGLAVDNSSLSSQGRVYVTSNNTSLGAIYAYPPGAATTAAPQPPAYSLALKRTGGAGSLSANAGWLRCAGACSASIPAGANLTLSADPAQGSTFAGWSGACEGSDPTCAVRMDEAATVGASFVQLGARAPIEGTTVQSASAGAATATAAPAGTQSTHHRVKPKRAKRKSKHRKHPKAHRAHHSGVKAIR